LLNVSLARIGAGLACIRNRTRYMHCRTSLYSQ
jgi:hypothetical protein